MSLDLSDRKKLLKTYFLVHSSAQKSNQFFFQLKGTLSTWHFQMLEDVQILIDKNLHFKLSLITVSK